MARIHLETSFVSACVTQRQDIESQYRRTKSCAWWDTQSAGHELFVSLEVIDELASPGHKQRDAALQLIERVPLIEINPDVRGLAHVLVNERVMPSPARGDAVHVALACVHGIDFVLTWNVQHLANMNKRLPCSVFVRGAVTSHRKSLRRTSCGRNQNEPRHDT